MKKIITKSAEDTKELGKDLAKKFKGGEIICLKGDLGSGKTTFSQGILDGLMAEKPYTSPTFLVMKNYKLSNKKIKNIYHIDTYRVGAEDILELGWEEIIEDNKNIVIVEWPERISEILPENSLRINFKWINDEERVVYFL